MGVTMERRSHAHRASRLIWLGLAAACFGGRPAVAAVVPFEVARTIQSSSAGLTVCTADFDRDGDIDVAGVTTASRVVWYENSGSGGTWTARTVVTAAAPRELVAADINGDGWMDLVAEIAGNVVWYENDGTPAVGAWPAVTIDSGGFIASIDVMDGNRDGHLDVVGASDRLNDLLFWRNSSRNGDGSTWQELAFENDFVGVVQIRAANLNGDAYMDVVAVATTDGVSWWQNGALGFGTERSIATTTGALAVQPVNLDGDGDMDVVTLFGAGTDALLAYTNTNGSGTAWRSSDILTSFKGYGSLYAADLDRDGDQDILTIDGVDTVLWMDHGTSWTRRDIETAFDGPREVTVADLDGDGYPDVLAAAETAAEIAWWRNHTLSIFVVNNNGDASDANAGDGSCLTAGGVCTLRAAIEEHNAINGESQIHFDLPGSLTIQPASILPYADSSLAVDGTTQPGYSGTPIVTIDGSAVSNPDHGIYVQGNSEVRGLVFVNWTQGIHTQFDSSDQRPTTIAGNYVGVESDGVTTSPNLDGVYIDSVNITVGGADAADRNVITAVGAGISLWSSQVPGVTIVGNYIGVDATGSAALATGNVGILGDAIQVEVLDNVISGQAQSAIHVGATDMLIQGNYIGTDASGLVAIPNGSYDGLEIYVAGTNPSMVVADNVIAASGRAGANIGIANDASIVIRGNTIGAGIDGITPMSNGEAGIALLDGGSAKNGYTIQVGGPNASDGNIIAYNALDGIFQNMVGPLATVRHNTIFSNGELGIDVFPDGVSGDLPDLTQALANGNRVVGTFASTPNATYTIDFYLNDVADPSGYGEGMTWIGSTSIFTDPSGDASFDENLTPDLPFGAFVTATATTLAGSTSEFSNAIQIGCQYVAGQCCTAVGTLAAAGVECRSAAHDCDAAEVCDGVRFLCPADLMAGPGTNCGDAPTECSDQDTCDGSGVCLPNHVAAGPACTDDGNACTTDTCDGAGNCGHPAGNAGTECRADAGDCDVAEVCDGSATSCPADVVLEGGETCDDGNPLTDNDVCQSGGICLGVAAVGTCGAPIDATTTPFSETNSTTGRDSAVGTYGFGCGPTTQGSADIIYEIALASGGTVEVGVDPGPGYDAAVRLILNCQDGEQCLASADDAGAGGEEILTYTAPQAMTAYVVVEGATVGEDGPFDITIGAPGGDDGAPIDDGAPAQDGGPTDDGAPPAGDNAVTGGDPAGGYTPPPPSSPAESGCGCGSTSPGATWALLALLLAVPWRRRRT